MDQEMKVMENRIRRMAHRRGFRLEKSRRRDPEAMDYGTYRLYSEDGSLEADRVLLEHVEKIMRNVKRSRERLFLVGHDVLARKPRRQGR
jgi:hypothetical protein